MPLTGEKNVKSGSAGLESSVHLLPTCKFALLFESRYQPAPLTEMEILPGRFRPGPEKKKILPGFNRPAESGVNYFGRMGNSTLEKARNSSGHVAFFLVEGAGPGKKPGPGQFFSACGPVADPGIPGTDGPGTHFSGGKKPAAYCFWVAPRARDAFALVPRPFSAGSQGGRTNQGHEIRTRKRRWLGTGVSPGGRGAGGGAAEI